MDRTVLDDDTMGQFVADADGLIVGTAEVAWDEETSAFVGPDEAELVPIHVDPDHRGEGVGTKLLERGDERPPPTIGGIALGVLVDNERARRFYERRGVERSGETVPKIGGVDHAEAVYRRGR